MKIFKRIKWSYVVLSVMFLLLGIYLVVNPETSLIMICRILGAAMAVFGVMKIVLYFIREVEGVAIRFDFAVGLFCIILGALMLWRAPALTDVLSVMIGLLVLVDSVFKLQVAVDSRRMGAHSWWVTLVCTVVCLVLGVLLVRRRGRRVLAGAALVLCVLCYAGEWRINRWTYEVPAGTAQQASALNDALAELDGRVLFIPYGVRQRDSQLIETYVARDVYIVEYETLLQSGALADGVLDLAAEAVGPEYPGRAYTDLDAADWVLAADGVPVDTTTLEKADAACPAGYVLYRNLDAQRVRFAVS